MTELPKTLVIGSAGHQHVTSIDWPDMDKVNVVDFDLVVISTKHLTRQYLKKLGYDAFSSLRRKLARLLASNGRIVVIADQQVVEDGNGSLGWSPLNIRTVVESGDTINLPTPEFLPFLSNLKKWSFYFVVSGVTDELQQLCGSTKTHQYQLVTVPLAYNRYEQNLAATYFITIIGDNAPAKRISMTWLPAIASMDNRTAVNLVLEELLSLPQEALPPEWATGIPMPLVSAWDSEISVKQEAIAKLKSGIADLEIKKRDVLKFKKLLYASGAELEDIFSDALKACGAEVMPARYSQEEFILKHDDSIALVECKGVGKSIALSHLRQLVDYTLKYEEDEGVAGKGVLLGNAWKDEVPSSRDTKDKPVFPANVVERAKAQDVALVSSVDFYFAFCRVLADDLPGNKLLDLLFQSTGVVDFSKL